MPGVYEYISAFGDRTFQERPFGDADNLVLCQLIYLPIEQVVSPDLGGDPIPFADMANAYFQKQGCRHRRMGLLLTKQASINMMRMAQTPRFSSLRVVGAQSAFSETPALQYGVATFLLPDGTAVVTFRGTDDSLTGWHEDLDIFIQRGMQSYPLAQQYLKDVAAQFSGDIILCGHSKGGNIALYTALTAEKQVRDRIRCVYNNEGPGFCDYSLYHTGVYDELLERYRHLVPHASFIGMFLAHDYDYTVVENKHQFGPLQHDITYWQIRDGELVTRDELNVLGRFSDVLLSNLIFRLNEDDCPVLNEITERLMDGAQVDCLLEAVKKLPVVAVHVLQAWLQTPKDTRDLFRKTLHGVTHITVQTAKNFKRDTVPQAAAAAKILLRKVQRSTVSN